MNRPGSWATAILFTGLLAAQSSTSYVHLPLVFEANHGQAAERVRYLARGAGYAFYLTSNEAILSLRGEATPLKLSLLGSSGGTAVVGAGRLPGKSHYLIGSNPNNWITDVPQYSRVEIPHVYPGIDLVYHGDIAGTGRLEYDFVVAPGADPKQIALTFGPGTTIDARSGDLLLAAGNANVRQLRPRIFQDVDGQRREIRGRYVLAANHSIRFALGRYDRRRELVIDPVFLYGTVLPGSGADSGLAVAADSSGNAYVTGYTTSSDFLTASPFQGQPVGGKEVFVSKVNAAGTALLYSTYIGGSSDEEAHGIAVDATGNAYIAGWTESSDFPTRVPIQAALLGTRNAFVAELNPAGSALVYSTYLGGSGADQANGIAIDPSGAAYLTGSTNSTNFPVMSPARATLKGTANAFVSKIAAAGARLVYSTYLGGSGTDSGNAIAVASSGDAYVAGSTTSADFPLAAALQSAYGGGGDAFLTHLTASGSALTFSSFFGGAGQDDAYAIALDHSNNVYLSGFTTNISSFPTLNPLPPPQLAASGFLMRFNSALGLSFSTILSDNGRGVAVDGFGNSYVAYMSRLNPDGTGIDYSLPVSGTIPRAITIDASGNLYIVGQGATLVAPSLANPKDFTDVSLVKIGEPAGVRINLILPTTVAAGSSGTSVSMNGAGFVSGAIVNWNGSPRTTASGSATHLTVALTAADFATAGVNSLTVVNPSGATSNPVAFTVVNPAATITSLSPASATAGSAAFTLTVNGTNFIAGSTVYWNGAARASTLMSATQLTASITAADIATGALAQVQVLVPTPGGGLSAASTFSVNNPAPAITLLTPSSASLGGADFTIIAQGSNFTASSVVQWNGSARATTFVSKVQLRATIIASDIAAAGTAAVTVFTPTPGGGTSAEVTFAVSGTPPPAITSLAPANVSAASGAFTLTINGTGFISTSQVQWNAANRATMFVSATQLTAAISPADVLTAGTASVTVVNAAPGSGTSTAATFTVNNPTPVVVSLSPNSIAPASSGFTLTVNGSAFSTSAGVLWNNTSRVTTYVSATQLTAAITAADVLTAGTAQVSVTNPTPGGGTSGAATFTIGSNPVPQIASLLPASVSVGASGFTLIVNGSGFVAGAQVALNGVARATTVVSSTQVSTQILTSDLAAAGTINMTVVNPTPGGGASPSVAFIVSTNAAPVLMSVSPSSSAAGAAAATLTLTGSGFVASSQVQWNGANRATTYLSATQLTASITAVDQASAGIATITVSNIASGGGISAGVTFTVGNPAPVVATLTPSAVVAGSGAFTLTVAGSGFVSGATVQWNGAARATTFVSATQLTASISAGDVAAQGAAAVSVVNPAPGGGTSSSITLTMAAQGNPAPAITTVSPVTASVNAAALTLTINGSGFTTSSQAQWNGASRTTTFVSTTQLTAAISSGDLTTVGTDMVTVVNPAPGGGTSAGVPFTVTANPAPALASIVPASAGLGGSAFTLTATGSGFIAASQVQWGGTGRTTTFVSATQLTAAISASDIATAGTAMVTVVNSAPGGGTSSSATFTINNPTPLESGLLPASAVANSGAFTLTVTGGAFVTGAAVQWNGSNRTTTFVSSTQLTATITASDIAAAGTATITVLNPTPGGGVSAGLSFAITSNPAPVLASIQPSTAAINSGGFTLTVNGSGFVGGSVVQWNGSARTTLVLSANQILATITAADVATAGSATVTVVNPTPGGGTSSGLPFTVSANPAPAVASIVPAAANVGAGAFTLTVTGTGFVAASTVQWNGAARATTYVSTTQLTAAILASDLLTAGTSPVTVLNPAPGGGTSASVSFAINNPVPAASGVSPASMAAASSAFTLTVNGSGFVAASTVQWSGAPRTTTYVSATQLTAAITASDVASAGTGSVTVANPAPGGGTSAGVSFAITANPAPSLSGIQPTSAAINSGAFTLTVSGSGFVAASTVQWNGAARTTTLVSGTQLTAAITAGDVAAAGTAQVTVTNPAPGGGTSAAGTFTITANPSPAIASILPASAGVGSAALTLTLTGSGFVPASQLQWNSAGRATTYISGTQLTANITVADLASAGTASVTVVNPAPGGGTSASVSFAINNPAPAITTLNPATVVAASSAFTLTVNGTGFVAASTVMWNGTSRVTTFVNATQLTAAITVGDVASAGSASIAVVNPAPGGGTSAGVALVITSNPAPVLASIQPTSAAINSGAFALTVNGSGFVGASTVQWNGANRVTTFVSSTQLTAAILAGDLASIGTAAVTVATPAPGGGTSVSAPFTIAGNPVPVLASILPASANAGASALTITATGSGFLATSQLQWNGAARATTFVSATQLTAAVTLADLSAASTAAVTVVNPTPGGGASSSASFAVNNPAPSISSVTPNAMTTGSAAFTLTVNGSGFVAASTVQWNGVNRATTYVSATQLNATIVAADVASAGATTISVSTPAPGGGVSPGVTFQVTSNPVPSLASVLPSSANVGSGALTVTVAGGGFIPASVVQWNGTNRATTYVSATQLTAAILAGDLAAAATAQLTVLNPTPGGGASSAASFVVGNPPPAISGRSPASIAAGSDAFTLTLNGTGFVSTSQVQWNGANRATTFVNATQLTAAIAAADVASAGSVSIAVVNPAPGGGASSAVTFSVTTNPVPAIASILPASVTLGSGALTLTITGSGFTTASVAQWNASNRATTYVSATQLTAAITVGDLAAATTAAVTVGNPAPGGGTSTAATFTVGNPIPALTAISPSSAAAASGAFTLALNGSGFVSGSTVQWNGANRATTFVNGTQLTAQMIASDLSTSGFATVSVVNPTPGGGASGTQTFTITANPAPAISTIAPSAAALNSGGFTMTIAGSGFIPASQVTWNGANRATSYVNSTQITASILASDIAALGVAQIAVSNPTPGGGVSTGVSFTVSNPTPVLAALLPATAPIGSGSFTLAVLGAGFMTQSQVQWNGANRATTYVSTTEVTAVIFASDLLTIGSVPVTVTNPAPGGGVSNPPDIFTVTPVLNPTPAITSLSPPSATVNTGALTLVVNGSGFVAGSQVQWNGTNRATTFISTTQLTASMLAADFSATGVQSITVVNSAPGGGTSNTMAFPVNLSCAFTLTPSASSFAATASTGTIALAAASGCAWSAASLDAFITITSNVTGSGSATLAFSLDPNASSARSGTLIVAGQLIVLSQAGTLQGAVAATPMGGTPGTSVRIPVTLVANSGVSADKLAFSMQIVPNGAAPALSGTLGFSTDAALGAPSTMDTSGGAGLISVTWLSLASAVSGTTHLGDVMLNIPASGVIGQTYTLQITGASGSYHASSVALSGGGDAALTLRLNYLVGDTAPFTGDAAGTFGNGAVDTVDLISVLRAVTAVPGYTPAACSDRFDALDTFPSDTATTRGGDGILNTLDLLAELQRVSGIDASRPLRVSRGLSCSTTQSRPPVRDVEGSLEVDGDGAVYLVAVRDLSLDGLALSLASADWAPAPGLAPALIDRGVPEMIAMAWTSRIEAKAGERLLLGHTSGANVRVIGVSAHSGTRDVSITPATRRATPR